MNNYKNCWTVYCHTTPSGKRYIGITCRKPEHRWNNGNGYIKDTPFGKAIGKYGWNDIKHNILFDDLTEKEAKWLENYLICYYWTFVGFKDSKGYNCTLGGEGTVGREPWNKGKKTGKPAWNKGKTTKEESRRKNSEAHKGKKLSEEQKRKIGESNKGSTPWNKGKTTPEETRRKQSESNKGKNKGKTSWSKGKHLSEEHKRKIGESNKGSTPWKGKHHTEEEKKRISTSLIGHQSPIKGKHWKLIDGKRFYYE